MVSAFWVILGIARDSVLVSLGLQAESGASNKLPVGSAGLRLNNNLQQLSC